MAEKENVKPKVSPVSMGANEESAIDKLKEFRGQPTSEDVKREEEGDSERELNIMVPDDHLIEIADMKMEVFPLSIKRFKQLTEKLRNLSSNEKLKGKSMSDGKGVTDGDVSFMNTILDMASDELINLIAIFIPGLKKMDKEEVEDALTVPKIIEIFEYVKEINQWSYLKRNLLQGALPAVADFIGEISSKLSRTKKGGA